ncbi:hypothetical protein [Comamonas thiooxydans]|uniref:hypothetical protein n=1 Tax=Comamonas thiooxydans TaxID=363952 RepID=UPI00051021EF|nr:hypothetical protein [Comamonas thiooxydans]KGH23043.1 hypothetical protein P606_13495 [Comamonas thiooxydans]
MSQFKFRFVSQVVSLIVASSMMVTTTTASASGAIAGATEITQLLNNGQLLMQVIEAKSQTVTQIRQLYELYKTAEREVLHLKSIGSDIARLASMAKEKDLGNLLKMINLSESIYGNVKDLGGRLELRYQEAYNQGLSIKDYILNEGKKVERKEKQAVARVEQERNIIDHLQDDLRDIGDLASKIPMSEGTQQSLGLMNTQMNKLLVSMNRIGQIMQSGQENVKKAQDESDALIQAQHAKRFSEQLDRTTDKSNATKINDILSPSSSKK